MEKRKDHIPEEKIVERFSVSSPGIRHSMDQGADVPIIRLNENGGRELVFMRWGLVPRGWSTPNQLDRPLVHARCETVHERGSFADSFRRRRCLLPMQGYNQRGLRQGGGSKVLYWFSFGEIVAAAAIWDTWSSSDGETVIDSVAMLTCEPNPLVAEVHDRMPVILPREAEDMWLTAPFDLKLFQQLFIPCPAELMTREQIKARPPQESRAQAELSGTLPLF